MSAQTWIILVLAILGWLAPIGTVLRLGRGDKKRNLLTAIFIASTTLAALAPVNTSAAPPEKPRWCTKWVAAWSCKNGKCQYIWVCSSKG